MLGNIFRNKKDAPTAAVLEAQARRANKIQATQRAQTARNIATAQAMLEAATRRA